MSAQTDQSSTEPSLATTESQQGMYPLWYLSRMLFSLMWHKGNLWWRDTCKRRETKFKSLIYISYGDCSNILLWFPSPRSSFFLELNGGFFFLLSKWLKAKMAWVKYNVRLQSYAYCTVTMAHKMDRTGLLASPGIMSQAPLQGILQNDDWQAELNIHIKSISFFQIVKIQSYQVKYSYR